MPNKTWNPYNSNNTENAYQQAHQNQQEQEQPYQIPETEIPYQKPLEDTVTKWLQDNSDILTCIEYQLRGYRKINNEWKAPTYPCSLLNEAGVSSVMQLTQSVFNKIMNTTNFTADEISEVGIYFSDKLIDMLTYNYNDYGIKRPQELQIITTIILIPFKGILKQSYENGTRRFLQSVLSYRESFQNEDSDAYSPRMGGRGKKGWSLFN